jgi:MscS family membrane protein
VLLAPVLRAQVPGLPKPSAPASTEEPAIEEDPLGRNTPRGTVVGFMKAADRGDYDQAASYLEITMHGEYATNLAQQLQSVLNNETSIDLNGLSRKPEGSGNSQTPDRELVGIAKSPSGDVKIWLVRVHRANITPIWLFSRGTLQQVPDIYDASGNLSGFEKHIPRWLKVSIFSMPIWRLCVILVAVPLVLLIGSLAVRLITKILKAVAGRFMRGTDTSRARRLIGPLRLILFGILFLVNSSYSLTLLARNFWRQVGYVLLVFGFSWMTMRIVEIVSSQGVARLRRNRTSDKIALANLLSRLLQIAIFIIAVLIVLHLSGVNLTAAWTGLGIGGLAVAFAAQKTLENLFGGIMIISDSPVRIGDACKVGDVNGTVVDIGLRSTRIRTLDRTIVTIPNGQLATMNLENFTLRDKFWFHPAITLQQQTTDDQMKTVLRELRELLQNHSNVEKETMRVRFTGIGISSQNIDVFAYIFAPDYNQFLAIQEDILLQILTIVESSGTALALPTQVSRLVREPHPGEQGSRRANDSSPVR